MADQTKADKQGFETTALPHLDSVYRAAVALCGSGSEAEDLVQTTFMKAFERFDTFKPGTDCKGWLMRILRNTWIDRLRHRATTGTTVSLAEDAIAPAASPAPAVWTDANDLLENFSDAEVIRAMGELSDEQRLTLFLVDVEQMSVDEAAAVLEIAPGTVKSRSNRARNALKAKLTDHARDLGYPERRK